MLQTAAEAPRAAAELVGQLRDKLSDSLARDNAMLDERSRMLATLNTLLDAVQHSTTGQRAAIDTLLTSTADWLERSGARFTEKIDAELGAHGIGGRAAERQRGGRGQPGRGLRRRRRRLQPVQRAS